MTSVNRAFAPRGAKRNANLEAVRADFRDASTHYRNEIPRSPTPHIHDVESTLRARMRYQIALSVER